MISIIASAIALFAFAETALAGPQMPRDMQGTWCSRKGEYGSYFRGPCDTSDFVMEVTAAGFEVVDSTCSAVNITKFDVYTHGKRAPANPWGPGYRITFRCKGEGRSVTSTQKWTIEKGEYLYVD